MSTSKSSFTLAGLALPLARIVAVLAIASVVSGCMQSTTAKSADQDEVYVYKGRADPLMSEPVANRAALLSERFKLIQGRQ